MKLCLYARQQCKWLGEGCPREELHPLFASQSEAAVHEVWRCDWAGSRVTAATYLMYLIQKRKLGV